MTLSKSQYIRALQCPKSIWLYKNKPKLRSKLSTQQRSAINQGYSVGDFSKELFPDGVEVEFDSSNYAEMIAQTKRLIDSDISVIYEATFHESGIFAMADILVRNEDAWDVYEVKAPTKVKEYHRNDVAIQWHALSKAIKLNKAYVVHIDSSYIRNGEVDIHRLFKIVDITDDVLDKQQNIEPKLLEISNVLEGEEPKIKIGPQCTSPFGCDFKKHCWQDVPSQSVFNLYRLNKQKKFDLFHQGFKRFQDIPMNFKLTKIQQIQVQSDLTQEVYIDDKVIGNFVNKVEFPVNFLDFETLSNGVPRFNNQKPYGQIPFQYSLHILHQDGVLEHKEFLASENEDPRQSLVTQLLNDVLENGSIVAFNQSFEKSRIKELAALFPEHTDCLLELNTRFVDLIEPFKKLGLYHPDFNGSFSIKSILPALFPNDDELDYKSLDIQNGAVASEIFGSLHSIDDIEQRKKVRKDLLAYCHLDTLAMVKIWQKLLSYAD